MEKIIWRQEWSEWEYTMRKARLLKLSETDWWAVQDRTMSQEEKDYRQALRDITNQEGFPENIVWPQNPHEL